IRSAFVGTGRAYAAETFDRVGSALAGYVSRWVAMRTEACEATHLRGTQSAHLLDLRMSCLTRRKVQLGALTSLLSERPDPQVLDKSVQAALGLPGLETCADAAVLTAEIPPPEQPAVRAAVEGLQRRLAAAQELLDAGKLSAGLGAAEAVARDARALD